jgi:hypothetical protein
MKRTLRAGICLILALIAALPASAQTSFALPAIPRAEKGETVTICLRDGRELTGVVGNWVDAVGFYFKPADSPAYLIHPGDIVLMTNAGSGAMRLVPARTLPHRMSPATKATIAALAVIGGLLLLKATIWYPMG